MKLDVNKQPFTVRAESLRQLVPSALIIFSGYWNSYWWTLFTNTQNVHHKLCKPVYTVTCLFECFLVSDKSYLYTAFWTNKTKTKNVFLSFMFGVIIIHKVIPVTPELTTDPNNRRSFCKFISQFLLWSFSLQSFINNVETWGSFESLEPRFISYLCCWTIVHETKSHLQGQKDTSKAPDLYLK